MSDDVTAWRLPVPMRLIDAAEDWRQFYDADKAHEVFPQLREHDYRFEAALPGGSTVIFGCYDTAARIAEYLKREGVEL
jgi:hypothetical protein